MTLVRVLFFGILSLVLVSSSAIAKDYLNPLNYKFYLFRNGAEVEVEKKSHVFVKSRIGGVFKSQKHDTSEPWFKYEVEKQGELEGRRQTIVLSAK